MDKHMGDFKDQIRLEKSVSPNKLPNTVASTVKDRTGIFYSTWKTTKEFHPDVDVDKVMPRISRKFGEYKSSGIKGVWNAEDALLKQNSKAEVLALNQEIADLSPTLSRKLIKRRPQTKAFDELSCTKEEKIRLCTELLTPGDYGLLKPLPNIILEFPQSLASDNEESNIDSNKRRF